MVVRKPVGRPALFASLPLLVLLLVHASPAAPNATLVCGAIAANTTWILAAGPYVVTCDTTVSAGVTLTVEPGVVVKFETQQDDLIVQGRLLAQGTDVLPIVFTSYKDDAHGGDTNGDGSATSPAPGDAGCVALSASSSGSVLDHTWIGYGGYGGSPYVYANLHLYTSDVTVQNSTIAWSARQGMHVHLVDPAHPLLLTGNTFLSNGDWAVYDDTTGTRTDITLAGNTSSGSPYNGYGLMGSVVGTVTFSSPDAFPFVIWDSYTNLSVDAGSTLTFSPGTVVKFTAGRALIANGRLLAQGTDVLPIVFTSYKDDAHGGDTDGNGSATGPAPNDWSGIGLAASSGGSVLDHTWIGYGGYGGVPYSYANLHLYTSDVTVQNSTIAWSNRQGVHVGGVDPAHPLLLMSNTFLNNTEWAVFDDTTGTRTDITLLGNTSIGSANNGYGLKGSVAGTVTFSSPDDFPFIIWDSWTDLSVDAGSTLTFGPGTVVKFQTLYSDLQVNGHLVAQGLATVPVVFTSYKDDAHGGDTNGNGSANGPAPGDWSGILVPGDATLSRASLLYTGYSGYAALTVQPGAEVQFADGLVRDAKSHGMAVSGTGRLQVAGSHIDHNQGSALVVDGDDAWVHVAGSSVVGNGLVGNPAGGVHNKGNATVVLGGEPGAGNTILANAGFGAYQQGTGTTLLATYNWWGDAGGPYHLTLNPGGLGEEVSDRVIFDPWLTESRALPAAGLVDLLAPLSFSPGETINLGVRFGNVLTETLNDVVVVAQLPELSRYLLSTEGGVYRPEEHDVIWRLGDVALGLGLNALVRVETPWGLPDHTFLGTKALVAAANLANPAVDLAEVLSYAPVTTLTQYFLTPDQIGAELAADPELDGLLRQAQGLGFTFYDTALSETTSIGGDLLTLVLLDRERMDQVVYVRRDGDQRGILHTTSAYATEYNDAGGWHYSRETGEWSFWGDRAAATTSASLANRESDGDPTDPCDWESEKDTYTCRRNCIIRNLGGVLDRLHLEANKQNKVDSCIACQRLGIWCDTCARKMIKLSSDSKETISLCWYACAVANGHTFDCDSDQDLCHWNAAQGRFYVRRELCDLSTCNLSGWTEYLPCNTGAPCVNGCCEGVTSVGSATLGCTQTEGDVLSSPTIQVTESGCACAAGLCAAEKLEDRTAHDPNAKLGPAEAAAGEWISYTVQYENLGAGTAYGVYVEDRLSPLLDDSTLQLEDGGLYFPAGRTIYWPVGDLAPGAGGSLDFRVQVPTDAVSSTVIMNSAMVYFPSVPETTPTGDVVTLVMDLVAHSQRVETVEGVPLPITLSGYSPVGPVSYHVVQGPGGGTLGGTPPNVTYTPAANFEGPDRFTFRVSDGLKDSAAAEVSILVRTGAETVPPEVFAVSPSRDETGVQVSDAPVLDAYSPSIYVYFAEPINPATVTAQTLFVADALGRHLAGTAIYDAGAYAARFVPLERFQHEATYTATVTTGVHDTSGNALPATYVWSFTTEAGPAGKIYLPLVVHQR